MPNLDRALEKWLVLEEAEFRQKPECPEGWWAVVNDEGIIAYFRDEADAFRFRFAEINREMNG